MSAKDRRFPVGPTHLSEMIVPVVQVQADRKLVVIWVAMKKKKG